MNKQDLVTIAIPTYNRADLLKIAIQSCLSQKYNNLEILVIDGGSTDNTKAVVKSFKDLRIVYTKNKTNIGMMGSWNRSITLAKGKYLLILGDDDVLYPDFISEALKVYVKHPNLGFIFTHANKIDIGGNFLMRWGYHFTPSGYLSGLDYLFNTIKYGSCLTISSTMLCRKDIYQKVGFYEAEFAKNTFDLNMYIKIAEKFDIFFINKVLADIRIHPKQVSEIHWRRKDRPTGKIGTYLEIFKAIGIALSNKKFADKNRKNLVLRRIREIDKELTNLLVRITPEL